MKQAFEVVFISIVGVFLAMMALTMVLYALRGLGQIFTPKREEVEESELNKNEEIILLLSAAAYVALGKRVKIHKVHIHREPYVERWSYAGRMDIHLSHQKSGVNQ